MAKPSMLVKVGENEFKPLLNRDETITDIRAHLSPWLDLLRDLSNYGSNLIPRCFSSSVRGLKDALCLGLYCDRLGRCSTAQKFSFQTVLPTPHSFS